MHKVTMVLYDCKPLKAKLSRAACATACKTGRKMRFNNDHEGDPFKYAGCLRCSGLQGDGEAITVTAGDPRPNMVPVLTIDGGWGYA